MAIQIANTVTPKHIPDLAPGINNGTLPLVLSGDQ